MGYFFCRLDPPRADFAMTTSEPERALMARHAAYLAGFAENGRAVVYGPVLDPAGPWALAIMTGADEAEIRAILDDEPTIRAAAGFRYAILPMMQAVLGKSPPTIPTP